MPKCVDYYGCGDPECCGEVLGYEFTCPLCAFFSIFAHESGPSAYDLANSGLFGLDDEPVLVFECPGCHARFRGEIPEGECCVDEIDFQQVIGI